MHIYPHPPHFSLHPEKHIFTRFPCARHGAASWPMWCIRELDHKDECDPRRKWWRI